MDKLFIASTPIIEETTVACYDDESVTDSYGDYCEPWYSENPGDCGVYDDANFTASIACCACQSFGTNATASGSGITPQIEIYQAHNYWGHCE